MKRRICKSDGYLTVKHNGKAYSPRDPKIEMCLRSAETSFERGDSVEVELTGQKERFGDCAYIRVKSEYGEEMWLERKPAPPPAPKPEPRRPCLVNVITGERTYGPAGMDEEMLFESLYS